MLVRDLMDSKVLAVYTGTTYEQVFKALQENNAGGAIVLDEDERLVGFVSEKDLFRILYPFYTSYYDSPEMYTDFEEREGKPEQIRSKRVEVFMKRDVFTIGPNEPALKAGALMLARSTDRLTVMENGKPIGTLYRKDIYKKLLEEKLNLK